ncbi:MAG: hypothetical protein JXB48_21390 [Candidatus Latescibacteria bacterium]|nr:hypothetical protein [Candidatus Latescibacterota bacterium]
MKRFMYVVISLLLTATAIVEAEDYPDWKGFPPMNTIYDMVEFNGKMYCASKGGMFSYDPENEEYKLYYKNHGMLSNNVHAIAATSEYIFLGFKEAGLVRFNPETDEYNEILFPEYTANSPAISINSIFAYTDSILFIGHSLGVDKINIYTKELKTFTNLIKNKSETPVNDVKVIKGKIWVCTPLGIVFADVNNPDLEVVDNWTFRIYLTSRYLCVERINDEKYNDDRIFFGTLNDGIQYYDEVQDKILPTAISFTAINDISSAFGFGWAAGDKGLYRKMVKSWFLHDTNISQLNKVYGTSDSTLWVGSTNHGLRKYNAKGYQIIPAVEGPTKSSFVNIDISPENVLWITTTKRDPNTWDLLMRYEDGEWAEYGEAVGVNRLVVDVQSDLLGNLWLATWGRGLFVMSDDDYPERKNVEIQRIDPDFEYIKYTGGKGFVVCSEVTKDHHGNIWVANHLIEDNADSGPIVFDVNDISKHTTYSPLKDGLASAEILNIETDADGWVWLGTYEDGLMALYVGNDPFDKSDTNVVNLNLDDELHSMQITAVKPALNGDVWVGTKGGLNRIKKLSGKRLKVDDMNSLLDGLGVEVSAIEVDRFNNKWIGTTAGLFKIDSNDVTVGKYTVDNSGLFSDTIFSLKYDNDRDILWIGTDTGLNQFFILGSEETNSDTNIRVYPNPFEIWGTNSLATFPNLEPISVVKIYNFNGDLVNELVSGETEPAGGASAVWNGWNFNLKTVGSGVYFFTGTDINGRQFKDKMVVIRR